MIARPCAPARRPTYARGSKIGLSNTIKRRFIWNGERSIDAVMTGTSRTYVTSRSRCRALVVHRPAKFSGPAQVANDPGKIDAAVLAVDEALVHRGRAGAERRRGARG